MQRSYSIRWFAVVALLVVGTAAHGYVTRRWTGGYQLNVTIPDVPLQFGEWSGEVLKSGVDDPELSNITRKYTHAKSGRAFTVSLTNGPPGLTAVHTPEYCYRGSGYEITEPIHRRTVAGQSSSFYSTVFRRNGASGTEVLRLCWGWSTDGQWKAPQYPRLNALGKPNLYKLYVIAPNPPIEDPVLDQFLQDLTAALKTALFEHGPSSPERS